MSHFRCTLQQRSGSADLLQLMNDVHGTLVAVGLHLRKKQPMGRITSDETIFDRGI